MSPTPGGARRLRVVMVMNARAPFEPAWAAAAATRVDLVSVRVVDEPTGEPTALPYLARVRGSTDSFQVVTGPGPITRFAVVGSVRRVLQRRRLARRMVRALRVVQAEQGPFDLLHGHFSASAPIITPGARTLGISYVITEHSSSFSGRNDQNQMSRRGLAQAKRACAGAGAVIPVSGELERAMRGRGIEAAYQVIPNPIDTAVFSAPDVLADGATIELTSVGRLTSVKGHDLLLEAIAGARQAFPQLRLTIVGRGPLRDQLQDQARRLGIDDLVTFAGYLGPAAIAQRLRASHAFVLASRWENLSVAALEACATGLPSVLSRVGGLSEIVAEGVTLVEADDVAGLTRAIHDTLSDLPDLPTRRRRAQAVAARYSVEAVGAQLDQAYRLVVPR